MNMTHPDILKMERDGYLDNPIGKHRFAGECLECGETIYASYDHYVDEEGNLFCCAECALRNYGITPAH